jgi:hypothetical protein
MQLRLSILAFEVCSEVSGRGAHAEQVQNISPAGARE